MADNKVFNIDGTVILAVCAGAAAILAAQKCWPMPYP